MNRLYEEPKLDIGLVGIVLSNTNATGPYYSMKPYRSALAILNGGAMAATKTSKIELLQAKDASGGSSQAITGAEATITANTLVTELTIALATVTAGQTVTIGGLVFTAHATTTTVANREFSIAGTDTADAGELATCINDATYGVPGVTATNNAGTLTLASTKPGEALITASTAAGTMTIATTKAQAYVELEGLDLDAGFNHIAIKVTTTAVSNVSALLLRGDPRYGVTQKVGASAAI